METATRERRRLSRDHARRLLLTAMRQLLEERALQTAGPKVDELAAQVFERKAGPAQRRQEPPRSLTEAIGLRTATPNALQ
jgi:hypothetical protein